MNKYKERIVSRGDLYYADLNPVVGSEQGGIRPVLIIQNDIGNKHSPTIIVAAITSKESKAQLPTHCPLSVFESGRLTHDSVALFEQIRTIDKRRLRDYIGTVINMLGVDRALAVSVGLEG